MRTFWPEPLATQGAALAAALLLAAAAHAQGADSSKSDAMDRLDLQIDRGADSAGDTTGPNTELWEEYQKYREPDTDNLRHSNERVEIGGDVTIGPDEMIDGDVVSIGGTVTVSGHVAGDCVAVGGDVILNDGAVIEGDAVSVGGKVRDNGDVQVHGERVSIDIGLNVGRWFNGWTWNGDEHRLVIGPPPGLKLALRLTKLFGVLLVAFLVYAVAGKRVEVIARRIDDEPGQSFLIGLLGAFATPFGFLVAVILLAITLIGILLIPVLAILLVIVAIAGFTAAALTVGRRVLNARAGNGLAASGPYRTLLIGLLALYSFRLLGWVFDLAGGFLGPVSVMFRVLGLFIIIFASILGYGALMTSRFGTRPLPAMAGAGAVPRPPMGPPPPPPPPPPPAPPGPPPAPGTHRAEPGEPGSGEPPPS